MRCRANCAAVTCRRAHWHLALLVSWLLLICRIVSAEPPVTQLSAESSKASASILPEKKISDAERVARLQRAIDSDEMLFRELKSEVDSPQSEYAMAESEFKALDGQLANLKKDAQKLRDEGKSDDLASLKSQIESVEKKWKLAENRFAVALEERKNVVGKIATLEEKLRKDREEVGRLTGMPDAVSSRSETSTTAIESAPMAAATTAAPAPAAVLVAPPPTLPAANQTAMLPASTASSGAQSIGNPAQTAGLPAPAGAPSPAIPATTLFTEQPPSPELIKARDKAKEKEAVALQAQVQASTIASRIDDLRKLIEQERKSMEFAAKKTDLAVLTERTLEQELERMLREGAPAADLQALRSRIAAAGRQDDEARAASRGSSKRLDDLQSELAELHSQQIEALKTADHRQHEAEAAQKTVEQLANPFAPKNVARWTADHGPRLLGCIVGMAFLLWLARRLERRLITLGVTSSQRGSSRERESRTRTVVSVFRNSASTAVVITGTVLLLNELGVNVAVLMGGAAVFGLAVAFGAQNLIRDYFCGFVILLENQYKLNDVVQVGQIAGQVERITLRMTVLRDLEGNVHFLPNGQIASVCNMTHGWSRALFEIPIGYKEDVDRVMALLVDIGKQMRLDPEYCSSIIEDPTMLGLDSFADSALIIKFYMKTKPLEQWSVKRGMLLRIKKRFDEAHVEIPFPHRTVYYRNLPDENSDGIATPPGLAAA